MLRYAPRAIAAALTLSLIACAGGAGAPTIQDRMHGSSRVDQNGWIFVHIQGSPDQMGYQHGYLLAPEITDLLRVVKPLLLHETKKDWAFYRGAAEHIMWPKTDPEYQQEIDGIVAGQKAHGGAADRWDLVALNAMEELPGYYVPWLEKQKGQPVTAKAPGNCSAFVATGAYTANHRIVMGHNAWTDYIVGSRWNVVFDMVPEQGHRMLMDGLPGVIVSDDDFGVNDAGMMITETTITNYAGFDPNGTPEFARARKAMQYGANIDDYVRIMLDGNNGGYANDWLIGDNKTGEIALFELGLTQHSVRRTSDGYFVGSNFPVDEQLRKAETTFDATKADSSPNARHTRWDQVMAQFKGSIDASIAKQMESDAYDVALKRSGPTERSLCGTVDTSARGIPEWDWTPFFPGGTVQAKVMDSDMADAMKFWGAMGHPCAPDFHAEAFLKQHQEYDWAKGLLRDMKSEPWTQFASGAARAK